jgi:hypothetical protein
MSDIIQFPSSLVNREKELHEKELALDKALSDLNIEIIKLEIKNKEIKNERFLHSTRLLVSFCVGIIAGFLITLPFMV